MAGHSQFKNIMYRKGAQDAKRAKVFTKIIRELTVASKTGSTDPSSNTRLRSALQAAKEANMPKDTIERAIKRGSGGEDNTDYQEIRYEGFGPGRIAFIVEALTDNRNRTASEIRAAFNKHGGHLGETGSVSFLFEHIGQILYPVSIASTDTIFEATLEAGAENVENLGEEYEITCHSTDLAQVREVLTQKFGEPQKAKLIWKPLNTTLVDDETALSLLKLIEVLEDNDDVQEVFANYEVSESFIEKLR